MMQLIVFLGGLPGAVLWLRWETGRRSGRATTAEAAMPTESAERKSA
jgi:hypothetical protein